MSVLMMIKLPYSIYVYPHEWHNNIATVVKIEHYAGSIDGVSTKCRCAFSESGKYVVADVYPLFDAYVRENISDRRPEHCQKNDEEARDKANSNEGDHKSRNEGFSPAKLIDCFKGKHR